MQALKAVLIDLFWFALRRDKVLRTALVYLPPVQSANPPAPTAIETTVPSKLMEWPLSFAGTGTHRVQNDAKLYADPVVAFDSVITTVPYGSTVSPLTYRGRWVQVQLGGLTGWLLRDDIDLSEAVLPAFQVGTTYDASNETTKRLRACIADDFAGALTQTLLTAEEYVTYALWRSGFSLPWPKRFGRVAGSWQHKLRGVAGIHIGVTPKTGAIMEYIIDDIGYLAYVDAVAPDLTIRCSGIGLLRTATYTEERWLQSDWRERRPVFITVV